MRLGQIDVRERCDCSSFLTQPRRSLLRRTAIREFGISPAGRAARSVVVCGLLLANAAPPSRAQQACEPLPDRSGCTQTVCFDGNLACRPTEVIHDAASGLITVKNCDCISVDDCYLDPSLPLTNICQGLHCPETTTSGCFPAVAANDDGTETIFCCLPPPCAVDASTNSCIGKCLNANRECRPTESVFDSTTGQSTITECDCVKTNECALAMQDGAPPICEGLFCLPMAYPCELTATHDSNGTTATYTCCPCLQPPEACCLPFFECQNVAPSCCPDQGGFAAGPGTSCTTPEECCFPNGSNQIQDPACCRHGGGIPQGPGTGDASLAPGACCLGPGSSLGTCVMINPYCCATLGGAFLGFDKSCLGDPDQTGVDDACECEQAPPNMVGWWTLDEITGTKAFDSSGYKNDGTHTNGFTPIPGFVAGAASFNGASNGNHVKVPHSTTLDPGTGPFSIDLWLRPIGEQTIINSGLVQKFHFSTGGYQFSLRLGGELELLLADSIGKCGHVTIGAAIPSGQWTHGAVTVSACVHPYTQQYGQRYVALYVNGQFNSGAFVCCAGGSDSLSNSFPLLIGFNGFESFGGDLDEVEVFNVELPATTIRDIYQAGSFGKCKCQPLRDRTGCTSPVCPIADRECVPTLEYVDAHTGQISVGRCECIAANACQLTTSGGSPVCAGPAEFGCVLESADTDGDGIADTFSCLPPLPSIPTVSEWGLVVLAMLLMTGAKIYFARQPTTTA